MKSARPVPRHPVSDETVRRVTVSLAQSDNTKLERIAEMKRVSPARVAREALAEYLERQPTEKMMGRGSALQTQKLARPAQQPPPRGK